MVDVDEGMWRLRSASDCDAGGRRGRRAAAGSSRARRCAGKLPDAGMFDAPQRREDQPHREPSQAAKHTPKKWRPRAPEAAP